MVQETLSELKKKYKMVTPDECEPHWNAQFKSSAKVRGDLMILVLHIYFVVLLRLAVYPVLSSFHLN
jgi:hypothetical protein